MTILFAVIAALLIASQVFDIHYTVKGIQAGVAVEGNSTVKWLFGPRPNAFQLYVHNTAIAGVLSWLAIAGIASGNPGIYGFGFGAMVSYALLHLRGGLKWRMLLKGGTLDGGPKSAWQKFLGV